MAHMTPGLIAWCFSRSGFELKGVCFLDPLGVWVEDCMQVPRV